MHQPDVAGIVTSVAVDAIDRRPTERESCAGHVVKLSLARPADRRRRPPSQRADLVTSQQGRDSPRCHELDEALHFQATSLDHLAGGHGLPAAASDRLEL